MEHYVDVTELTDFFAEICSKYHLGVKPEDKPSFIEWAALNAGRLFIKHSCQTTELSEFCRELCEYYMVGIPEDEKDNFIKWIVLNAGHLYINHVIEPEKADS